MYNRRKMIPTFPETTPAIAAMTETQLTAVADSAGQGVGSAIGAEITSLSAAQRKRILELINMLIEMVGG